MALAANPCQVHALSTGGTTSSPRTGSLAASPAGLQHPQPLKHPMVGAGYSGLEEPMHHCSEERHVAAFQRHDIVAGPGNFPSPHPSVIFFFCLRFCVTALLFFLLLFGGQVLQSTVLLGIARRFLHSDQHWADALIALSHRYLFPHNFRLVVFAQGFSSGQPSVNRRIFF